jgi:uncharacterized membrane protein
MGINSREDSDTSSLGRPKVRTERAIKIEQSVTINRPQQDLYRFWRQLDNLPKVMSHVRSVQQIDDRRSHWVVDTMPGAPTVEWDAEIINEVENSQGTRVTVTLQYDPPAGPIGAAIAGLFGQDPRQKIAEDLQRFKQTMESQAASSR